MVVVVVDSLDYVGGVAVCHVSMRVAHRHPWAPAWVDQYHSQGYPDTNEKVDTHSNENVVCHRDHMDRV